jgi:stage V sporulation protein R
MADKGRLSYDYQRLRDSHGRDTFDAGVGAGQKTIFAIRENLCDFLFINRFVDQDFVTRNKLFVADRRLNAARTGWEVYVKSRKAEDYRQMVLDSLYHPPWIEVEESTVPDKILKLNHRFEGQPLIRDYLANTLMGIEFLWGGAVQLETSEVEMEPPTEVDGGWGAPTPKEPEAPRKLRWQRVCYTMKDRQLSRYVLGSSEA